MKRRLYIVLTLLVVLPLLIAGAAAQTDWYLFTGGIDSNFQTIATIIGTIVLVLLFYFSAVRAPRRLPDAELTCSIDADCPPGYVCVGGRCVLATEAQPA